MTGQQLIDKFELQVDDSTELSSVEELDLLNKVYQKVCSDLPWEFLKKEFSSVTDGSTSLALPSDFSYFIEFDDEMKKIVWVGGTQYYVVKFSDRRQYTDQTNICYVDVNSNKLYFPVAPTSGLAVYADYISIPADLTLVTSPIFRVS